MVVDSSNVLNTHIKDQNKGATKRFQNDGQEPEEVGEIQTPLQLQYAKRKQRSGQVWCFWYFAEIRKWKTIETSGTGIQKLDFLNFLMDELEASPCA